MRAHQIGYSPTTPVSLDSVSSALAQQRDATTDRMPPIRNREVTEKEPSFGAISPISDSRSPSQPLRPVRRGDATNVVPVEDDDDFDEPRSNALSWAAIVVASVAIAVAGGYLLFGLSGSESPAISAAPPPVGKMIDEPTPPPAEPPPQVDEPPPPAQPPPPPEPVAGAKGVQIAKKCRSGKSAACLEAGDMFLQGAGGVPASKSEALALFDRACTLHSMVGCYRAAEILADVGEAKRARRLYEKACDSANATACDKLSAMWRDGIGGTQNDRTADAFAKRACKLGRKSSCK